MMKRYVPLLLDTLAILALAVWLGGLAFAWQAWFPIVHADPAGKLPVAFTETLRRFSSMIEICGLILLGIQWLLRRRYRADKARFVGDGVRFLLTFAALFCAEYMKLTLLPEARIAGAHGVLFAMQICTGTQGTLLVGITALTVWLQTPQTAAPTVPSASRQPSRQTAPPPKRRSGK